MQPFLRRQVWYVILFNGSQYVILVKWINGNCTHFLSTFGTCSDASGILVIRGQEHIDEHAQEHILFESSYSQKMKLPFFKTYKTQIGCIWRNGHFMILFLFFQERTGYIGFKKKYINFKIMCIVLHMIFKYSKIETVY